MVPVQLRHVIKEITSIVDHSFPKAIEIDTHLEESLHPVLADNTQLSQVLMNLCVNARDAMPNGGKLTIRAENIALEKEDPRLSPEMKPGPFVRLVVTDTGIGIAPEIIHRIFDPFFSTKDHAKRSGLGLSSVLGIVKSHGGFVDVESEVGKGARFSVYLPASPDAAPTQVGPPPEAPGGQGELILVVDDESSILETVKATLENCSYNVVTATDGAEALNVFAAQQQDIRLILLDMMMPGMDGPTTMTALRNLAPDVCIVATSGLRPAGPLAAAIGAGEVNFLPKPYSHEQLLTTLHQALHRN
jgi:CheY-like chemotaxis protein